MRAAASSPSARFDNPAVSYALQLVRHLHAFPAAFWPERHGGLRLIAAEVHRQDVDLHGAYTKVLA